jgi:hypothetical protein
MFHTPDVFIDELRSLEHFGSDHFPIYAKFSSTRILKTRASKRKLEEGEHEIVQEIIADGIKKKSDNRN